MESPSKEVDVLHEDEVSVLEKLKFNQNIWGTFPTTIAFLNQN